MTPTRRRSAAAFAALAMTALVGLAGCGDDSDDGGGDADRDRETATDTSSSEVTDDTGDQIAPMQLRRVLQSSASPASSSSPTTPLPSDCAAPQGQPAPGAEAIACDSDGVVYRLGPAEIEGGVDDASAESDNAGGWLVLIEFDDATATSFASLTTELAGTQQQLAIVSEGAVVSAPTIQTAIADGKVQIAGDFTEDEAEQLADALEGDD